MSMKTILVPMEKHDGMQSVLETALLLARGYDSYIEGFSLRWTPVDFAVGDTVGAFPVEPYKREMAAQAQRARQTFETFMQKSGVPRSTERTTSLSFGWLNAPLEGETFVGNYGRAFDVIVMNRPDVNSSPQSIANVGIGHNAIVLAVPILLRPEGRTRIFRHTRLHLQLRKHAHELPERRRHACGLGCVAIPDQAMAGRTCWLLVPAAFLRQRLRRPCRVL